VQRERQLLNGAFFRLVWNRAMIAEGARSVATMAKARRRPPRSSPTLTVVALALHLADHSTKLPVC
jgi:hypothetical protein